MNDIVSGPMTQRDLAKLIVRVAGKDREAFGLLYQESCARLFGVCLHLLKDPTEAERALEEVFVKVWARAGRFASSDLGALPWLTAIARHHAIDVLRARPPAPPEEPVASDAKSKRKASKPKAKSTRRAKPKAGEDARIHSGLDALEADRAAELQAAYLDGGSYAGQADGSGASAKTVRERIRGSLIGLKGHLGQ